MQSLTESVQDYWGSWGVFLFTLWALILTLLALARLLLLSQAVELYSDEFGNRLQVWIIFSLNTLFGLGFGASAYGLWRRHNWARLLFLWLAVIWSTSNLFALLLSALNPSTGIFSPVDIILGTLQASLGIIIPVWYFNIPRIKALFYTEKSENF